MPERVDGARVLAGLGGLILVISLFLNWFEPDRSAWTVFEVLDLVLAALGLAMIMLALPRGTPEWLAGRQLELGLLAVIVVVAAMINEPPAAGDRGIETGIWIALVGALLVTVAGMLGRGRVSLVISFKQAPPPEPPPEPRSETETMPLRRGAAR